MIAIAVKKGNVLVGHLSKGKTSRFAETTSFFLCGGNKNSYKVELLGKERTFAMRKDSKYLVNFILLDMQSTLTS